MSDPQRRFTVIEGGTGARNEQPLIDTGGTNDQRAEPKLKRPRTSSSSGGRGGGQAVTLARLEERVSGAFKWLGILTAAFGGAFLFYLWLMFGVRGDIASINQNVAVQVKATSGIERTLDRIDAKLDRQTPPQQQAVKQDGIKQ